MKNAARTAARGILKTKKRVGLILRRYKARGGFGAAFRRYISRLVKGVPRTLGASAVGLGLVILAAVLIFSPGGSAEEKTLSAAATPELMDIAALITPTPKPTPVPTPTPMPTPTPVSLGKGVTGERVKAVQERLMELGYMDYDEPTEYYGNITKEAVELFQRRHGLTIDGYVGETTYDALMRADALPYMVRTGDEGTDVEELQKRLVELDYMDKATGYFGDTTTAAVTDFQERNSIGVDGMIGVETREALYSESAVARSLSYGEASDEVLKYQNRLFKLGYLTTTPDGSFGRDTLSAVKLFQELNGLIADGHIGPMTRDTLMSSDAEANALTLGMSGDTVKSMQKKLKALGYLDSADGYFGSGTESAVRAFQQRNGLTADGKVGRYTMAKLVSGDVRAAEEGAPAATAGSAPAPTPSGSGTGGNVSDSASASRLIDIALSKLGCRYRTGAKGPDRFDCSGFVYWCLNKAGVKQGYMTSRTWRSVDKYQRISSIDKIQKGDILVFKMSSSKGHVGIALSSSEMVDASSGEGCVVRRSFQKDYWKKYFYCAYRIF